MSWLKALKKPKIFSKADCTQRKKRGRKNFNPSLGRSRKLKCEVVVSDKDQMNRIEGKIDDLIKVSTKNRTEITWLKTTAGAFFTTLMALVYKVYGGK